MNRRLHYRIAREIVVPDGGSVRIETGESVDVPPHKGGPAAFRALVARVDERLNGLVAEIVKQISG